MLCSPTPVDVAGHCSAEQTWLLTLHPTLAGLKESQMIRKSFGIGLYNFFGINHFLIASNIFTIWKLIFKHIYCILYVIFSIHLIFLCTVNGYKETHYRSEEPCHFSRLDCTGTGSRCRMQKVVSELIIDLSRYFH